MEIDEAVELSGRLYQGNCHCCEAIVRAVCEYMEIESDLLFKISTPFGGGMGSNGAACGSLIAAYLCLGAVYGRSAEHESRKPACDPADRIFQKFCREFGSPNCREITGYDKKDPIAAELHGARVKNDICIPLTKQVTRWILEEMTTNDA